MPMSIASNRELDNVRNVSLFSLDELPSSFPQTLPFSQLYPLCCSKIRNFVNEYYMFSFDSLQAQHDVDEILRKVLIYGALS
jgi:exocyst complex component 6